jgi:hypothetical protein
MSTPPSSLELSPVTTPRHSRVSSVDEDVGNTTTTNGGNGISRELQCIPYFETKEIEKVSRFLQEGGNVDAVPFQIPYYPNELQWTLLHWAAYYNALECVKLLVEKGANRNRKNSDGKTPLEVAKIQQTEILKALGVKQQVPSPELLELHKQINILLGAPPPTS